MANFEAFLRVISSSTNLLFLKSAASAMLHSIVGQQYVSGWVLTQINDVDHHEEKCPHYRDGKAFSSS